MKPSIAALIAAGLFLAAAYFGVGSSPAKPPASPQLIVLAGGSAGAPQASDCGPAALPSPSTSTVGLAAGSAQVLGIGHLVQRNSLKDLTSSPGGSSTGGPGTLAAGDAGSQGTQNGGNPLDLNTQVQPGPGGPGASPLPSFAAPSPRPTPSSPPPVLVFPSTPLGILFPTPTPSPTPTPAPSITSTVIPTSTAHP